MDDCEFEGRQVAPFGQPLGSFALELGGKCRAPASLEAKQRFKCYGMRDALLGPVRLPARIDERAQLDWSGSSLQEIGGSCG